MLSEINQIQQKLLIGTSKEKNSKEYNSLIELTDEEKSTLAILNQYATKIKKLFINRFPTLFCKNEKNKEGKDLINVQLDFHRKNYGVVNFDHHGEISDHPDNATATATTQVLKFLKQCQIVSAEESISFETALLSEIKRMQNWILPSIQLKIREKAMIKAGNQIETNKTTTEQVEDDLRPFTADEIQKQKDYQQKKQQFLTYRDQHIAKIMPGTIGYPDPDGVLANFALLYPEQALQYADIIEKASLFSDLGLKLSEKARNLSLVLDGLAWEFNLLRMKYFQTSNHQLKKLEDQLKKAKSPEEKITAQECLSKFSNELNKEELIFDSWVANTLIQLTLPAIEYCHSPETRKNVPDDLKKIFNEAKSKTADLIDEKAEAIKQVRGLQTLSVGKIGCIFSGEEPIQICLAGIPPESLKEFADNYLESDIKYLVIASTNNKRKKAVDIKNKDNKSGFQPRSIHISIKASSLADLQKYNLSPIVNKLNHKEQELLSDNIKKHQGFLKDNAEHVKNKITNKLHDSEEQELLKSQFDNILDSSIKHFVSQDDQPDCFGIYTYLKTQFAFINLPSFSRDLNRLSSLLTTVVEIKRKIIQCAKNGVWHKRNGLLYYSSSRISIDEIVEILQEHLQNNIDQQA